MMKKPTPYDSKRHFLKEKCLYLEILIAYYLAVLFWCVSLRALFLFHHIFFLPLLLLVVIRSFTLPMIGPVFGGSVFFSLVIGQPQTAQELSCLVGCLKACG